jgi:indole-3-glycerol phosphate synthase
MTEGQSSHLERILAVKRAELASARRDGPHAWTDRELDERLSRLPPTLDFSGALRSGPPPRVIAEFKRASPSAGPLREGARAPDVVRAYEDAGAACISVLTDRHFEGSLDDLRAARAACDLPILRKDFILERSQILESREAGADAVLLIVAALEPPTLRPLIEFVHELGMQALCEAHDEHELDRAMAAGARLLGVNNRDLRTFEIDRTRAQRLRARVPASFTYVAESGIESAEQIAALRDAGVDGVLIGSLLMAADDPGAALASLLDAAR